MRKERRWGQTRPGVRKEQTGRAEGLRWERVGGRSRPGDTETIHAKTDHTLLEMPPPKKLWWEINHWDEVWDEDLFWGDSNAETRRRVKELLRS